MVIIPNGRTRQVIANIEQGSPADLCGDLRVTDRILQINGRDIAEGTEVRDVSEYVSPRATIVEVIVVAKENNEGELGSEPLPPNHVRYSTQLAREPSQGLGMGLGYAGDSVVVASVTEGSPADQANLQEVCAARFLSAQSSAPPPQERRHSHLLKTSCVPSPNLPSISFQLAFTTSSHLM